MAPRPFQLISSLCNTGASSLSFTLERERDIGTLIHMRLYCRKINPDLELVLDTAVLEGTLVIAFCSDWDYRTNGKLACN